MVTQYMLRTHEGKWVFSEKKIRFVIFDYLIQIREIVPICAPTFELPSYTSTMLPAKPQELVDKPTERIQFNITE